MFARRGEAGPVGIRSSGQRGDSINPYSVLSAASYRLSIVIDGGIVMREIAVGLCVASGLVVLMSDVT
jgi:hypothetical protein